MDSAGPNVLTKEPNLIRQKVISAVGTRYVHELVLDLMEQAFKAYERRDHTKTGFGISGPENVSSTAGILLTAVAVEACRNRIFYSAKKRVAQSVADDLSKFLVDKDPQASIVLSNILKEIFTIRDVIAHNHLYEISIYQTDDWDFVGHRQRLLKGYGDKKFTALVSTRTKRTKFLGLNAQPLKIGFEDLWLVLNVFDLLLRIAENRLSYSIVFKSTYKFHGKWQQERGLSRLLSWYYDKTITINPKAGKRLKKTLMSICNALKDSETYKDSFLSNRCPKCDELGFRKPNKIYDCRKCGFEIKLPNSMLIG